MKTARSKLLAYVCSLVAVLGAVLWYRQQFHSDDSSALAQSAASALPLDTTPAAVISPQALTQTSAPLDRQESESERRQREYANWVRALVESLVSRGDAESLVVAAQLMQSNFGYFTDATQEYAVLRRQILELFQRAAVLAPANPLILRMALWSCSDTGAKNLGCDPTVYDDALRASDPQNGTVWIGEFDRTFEQGGTERQVNAIANMARATRFHDYGEEQSELLTQTVLSIRVPPPRSSVPGERSPMNKLLAGAPRRRARDMQPLLEFCKSRTDVFLADQCRQVAKLMREKGNVETAAAALGIEEQLAEPGSAAAKQAFAAQRRLAWQRDQVQRLRGVHVRFSQGRYTAAQLDALLREHGISRDPPPGWELP